MKKAKIIASVFALIIAVCIFSFGVYAATSSTITITSTISYTAPPADLDIIMEVENNKSQFAPQYYTTSESRNTHQVSATYIMLPQEINNVNLQFDELNTAKTEYERTHLIIKYTIYNYSILPLSVHALQEGEAPVGFTVNPETTATINPCTKSGETVTPSETIYRIILESGNTPTTGENNLSLQVIIER